MHLQSQWLIKGKHGGTPTSWKSVVANKVASVEFGIALKTELARCVEHESLIGRVDKERLLERLSQREFER